MRMDFSSHMVAGASLAMLREETAEAFRAWHRGAPLSGRQRDLIEDARIACFTRALERLFDDSDAGGSASLPASVEAEDRT